MTDRLAELGALAYAAENTATASTSPNRLGGAGYLHAAYAEYQTWAAANPNTNPSRLSAKGRLFGYFYDNASWSPSSLFTAGEQGAWYDPSDFSTMFQDATGTTPVTAVEQPVGLVLDKSKGLVLGPELVTNGGFDTSSTAGWIPGPLNAGGETFVASGGVVTLTPTSFRYSRFRYPVTCVIGKTYEIRASWNVNGALLFDLNGNGAIIVAGAGATNAVARVIATATTMYISLVAFDTLSPVQFDNISVKELPGNHASQSTTTKRAILRQDANGKYYLAFDGTDDSLATAAINFSATDKMSIFAGVRKNSDTVSIVAELSTDAAYNTGSFYLVTGNDSGFLAYSSLASGTGGAGPSLVTGLTSPSGVDTAVLTVSHDIAGDLSTIRRNGTAGTNGTGDKGAGNFGNYPLYIGQRGGSSLPLDGRIYGLIILGRTATATEITSTEAWVANKTGVTL